MGRNPYGSREPVAIEMHDGECRNCDDTGWVIEDMRWRTMKPCRVCEPEKYARWEAGEDVELTEATKDEENKGRAISNATGIRGV